MLIVPILEHSICFHLFVLSLICFFSVVQFSEYRSFTSLVRFIPRYFIFSCYCKCNFLPNFCFWYFIVGVQKYLSEYWQVFGIDKYVYHTLLPNSLISSSSFLVESIGFSMYAIISSANSDSFTSFLPIGCPLFPFLVWLLCLGFPILCWIIGVESGPCCLVLILVGKLLFFAHSVWHWL